MWSERDEMMSLVPKPDEKPGDFPKVCPCCGKKSAHILMHRAEPGSPRGTLWIWCDSCFSYSHMGFFVPNWWKNPDFIDEDKLDSFVDYPHEHEAEIDAWINELLG